MNCGRKYQGQQTYQRWFQGVKGYINWTSEQWLHKDDTHDYWGLVYDSWTIRFELLRMLRLVLIVFQITSVPKL